MIQVTDSAVRGLEQTLREHGTPGAGLRLAVERGGCAGMQYAMSLGVPRPGDLVVEAGSSKVFVDTESAAALDGCTLDYTEALAGAGFRVLNPRAARSCGCGTSFEPAS